MLKAGEVVLAQVQFTDTFETKKRPAAVLFEEFGNVVVAGITSNPEMKGIKLSKADGAIKESTIKTNYIFTITEKSIQKKLFELSREKKKELFEELEKRIAKLKE
ncbi:MAG: type II toxin-antitoxin system PemK/MazF family toxin [Candidatus ainarchaeum sp.]|nr:type II toxin-antitoxin system PemK/MazF family toxin [Candidatus ainarchaeum sp.]